jgi:hypothetical protein
MGLIPYFPSLAYGTGYDTLAQEVRGDSVVRTSPETVADTGGSIVDFRLSQVETHQELLEALDISASISLGNAITGGGSAQAGFSNKHSLDSYSLYLVVTVNVVKSHERMRDVQLNKDDAYDLMDKQGADAFRKRYGDAVVVGMTTGGRYFGLIQIHCLHQEDKAAISGAIRAAGGLGQWSASADFQTAVSKISSTFDLEISEHQEGGSDLTPARTVPDMSKKAVEFANSVRSGAAVPYLVELLDYEAIPLPQGKNAIDVQNQQDVLRQLADRRSALYTMLGNVEYVLEHQDQFDAPNVDDLNATATQLNALINEVYDAATSCFRDYQQCHLLTDMVIPSISLPKQKPGTPQPPVTVSVPDLVGYDWIPVCYPGILDNTTGRPYYDEATNRQLAQYDSQFRWDPQEDPDGPWIVPGPTSIFKMDPPPGTLVPEGTSVVLWVHGL